jgi:L-rhamnose mutarotase
MSLFALALNLKDDPRVIDQYVEHHRKVWPEVLAAIRAAGAQDIKIYLNGRHLFMLMSGPAGFDPDSAFADYQHDPVVQRWEALMQTFQEQLPGSPPGRWWTPLKKIFDLADT